MQISATIQCFWIWSLLPSFWTPNDKASKTGYDQILAWWPQKARQASWHRANVPVYLPNKYIFSNAFKRLITATWNLIWNKRWITVGLHQIFFLPFIGGLGGGARGLCCWSLLAGGDIRLGIAGGGSISSGIISPSILTSGGSPIKCTDLMLPPNG